MKEIIVRKNLHYFICYLLYSVLNAAEHHGANVLFTLQCLNTENHGRGKVTGDKLGMNFL